MAFRKRRVGFRKVCYFTKNKITYIDYKDVELLKRFISPNGKITPHQRQVSASAVRRDQACASDGSAALRRRLNRNASVLRRLLICYNSGYELYP